MGLPGDQEKSFLLSRIHKNFSIKKLISRLCVICAAGLLLSACATSSSTTSTDGDTVVDNLRLVYDEDRAEARQQAVTVSNDGKLIAFAYDNGIIKIVDLTTGRTVQRIETNYSDLIEMRYNFNNTNLILIPNETEVRILDLQTEQIVNSFSLPEELRKIAISSKDDYVAFGLAKGIAVIYDLESNKRLHKFNIENKDISILNFHPDGHEIAVATLSTIGFTRNKPLYVFNVRSGEQEKKFESKIYTAAVYSDSGKKLFTSYLNFMKTAAKIGVYNVAKNSFTNHFTSGMKLQGFYYNSLTKYGDFLLATTNDEGFEVIQISSGEIVFTTKSETFKLIESSKTGPKRIYPLYDGKNFLINYSSNNINQIYNVETNKITAYLYSDANDDFAVISRDGRMEGNQAAIANVAWSERNSNKRVPLDATFDRYYTPNLLQSLLSDDFTYVETEEDNLEKAIELAPDVEITRPDSIFTASESKVRIEASATSNGDPVKEIQILVNGKPIGDQRGLKVAGNRRTAEVELIPGQSTISAVAVTEQGYRSRPDRVVVSYDGQTAEANLYVLAIGIDEYKNNSYNLNYATTDAEALVQEIQDKAGSIFDNIEVSYISDDEATKGEIQQTIDSIQKQTRPQDMFVFYYAGHGVMSQGTASNPGDFYLALHDVTQLYGSDQMLADRGISAAELREAFGDIEARKQLIVLDACQSGGAVETFAQRGAAEEKAMIQLARSTGMTLLASTGTQQFATEFEELGHGVFTYSILEGLSGKADGGSGDGKITVKELEAWLNDAVPRFTQEYKGTTQYPRSWSQGMDFPIGVINN